MTEDRPSLPDSAWRRSRYCVGQSNCVEVAANDDGIGLRNSRSPGTVLTFDRAEWENFVDSVKSGEVRIGR